MPRISVICWIDPANPVVDETVAAYMRQSCAADDFELIMVAANIEDATRRRESAKNVSFLSSGIQSRAANNNAAAKQAKSPLLLFAAADFVPAPDFVQAHLLFHQKHPQDECVAIGSAASPEQQRCESEFLAWAEDNGEVFGIDLRPHIRTIPPQFFYCGNVSLKTAFFELVGRFDEAFLYEAGDDYEFGLRAAAAGMQSYFVPEATATHNHLITFAERKRQMKRAGFCAAVLASKHPHAVPRLEPLWKQRSRLVKAAIKYAVTRSADDRIRYWRVRLQEVFSRAYLLRARAT